MASKHAENGHYWRVVGMHVVGINYFKLSKNLSSQTSRFICDILGMCAVERSYPRPLIGRLFYRLCLRGLSYRDEDASGASRDNWNNLSGEHATKRECGYFCTASITESGLSYKQSTVISLIKEITAIFYHFPRINPYVDIIIWSYP